MFIRPMMILVVVNALIGSSATAEGVQQERGAAQGVAPYPIDNVDQPPEQLSAPRVEWPTGIDSGSVVVAFVIDTTGRVEPASIRMFESTHPDLLEPVRKMLIESIYRPGRVRGIPVRVLVEEEIAFTVRVEILGLDDCPPDPEGRILSDVAAGQVFLAAVVDCLPKTLSCPALAAYDPSLGQGQVALEFVIDALGVVEPGNVEVIEGVNPALDSLALEVIRSCRFRPGRIRGRAVRVLVQMPLGFFGVPEAAQDARPDRSQIFPEAAVDEVPERISCPVPEYPSEMLEASIEGQVLLQFVVETDGRVKEESTGTLTSTHEAFERPAMEMVAKCLFRPGRVGGTPVRVLVQMPLKFTLQDK